jgi:hypothetical protein
VFTYVRRYRKPCKISLPADIVAALASAENSPGKWARATSLSIQRGMSSRRIRIFSPSQRHAATLKSLKYVLPHQGAEIKFVRLTMQS